MHLTRVHFAGCVKGHLLMTKLKCIKHDKRVMVLGTETIIHRSDGSVCNSRDLVIGGKVGRNISKLLGQVPAATIAEEEGL